MQGRPDSTGEPAVEGLPSDDLPEHLKVNSRGLPGKVFLLRQKLYLKVNPAWIVPSLDAEDEWDVLRFSMPLTHLLVSDDHEKRLKEIIESALADLTELGIINSIFTALGETKVLRKP